MAMTLPSSALPGCVVVDANIVVSIVAKEAAMEAKASAALSNYSALGYAFFAPGVIISEVLYVLCGKLQNGSLTQANYNKAVVSFNEIMKTILLAPNGDPSLILRAAAIRDGYTCRRTSDAIYIALAEQLAIVTTTILLTFDQDLPKQAARHAPSVNVQLL